MSLSRGQRIAALALGRGGQRKDAAEAAEVSAGTVKRWQKVPEFVALVEECSDPAKAHMHEVLLTEHDPHLRMRAAGALGRPTERRRAEETDPSKRVVRVTVAADGSWIKDAEGEDIWRQSPV